MKALKIILYSIGGLALLYVILGLVGPKNYRVERSMVVNGSSDLVWNEIANFRNWPKWSPWEEKDPTVKNTYEGTDGTVGSIMKWEGDKDKTGTGQMVFSAMEPNKKIDYDLSFIVPFESASKGYFAFEPAENNTTKITWVDEGDFSFGVRPMMLFMNMDKMMGPDFERGLFKIDSLVKATTTQMKEEEAAKLQMTQEEAAMDSISTPEKGGK